MHIYARRSLDFQTRNFIYLFCVLPTGLPRPPALCVFHPFQRRVGGGGRLLPFSPHLRRRAPRPGFFSPLRLLAGAGGAAGVGAGAPGPGAVRAPLPCGGL